MRFKVGDRVRIKSFDWYNENKDAGSCVHCGDKVFDNYMSVFCGSIVTIGGVCPYGYDILEDMYCRIWTDEMFECKVEEETKPKYEDEVNGEYYSTPKYLVRPYQTEKYDFMVCRNGSIMGELYMRSELTLLGDNELDFVSLVKRMRDAQKLCDTMASKIEDETQRAEQLWEIMNDSINLESEVDEWLEKLK